MLASLILAPGAGLGRPNKVSRRHRADLRRGVELQKKGELEGARQAYERH